MNISETKTIESSDYLSRMNMPKPMTIKPNDYPSRMNISKAKIIESSDYPSRMNISETKIIESSDYLSRMNMPKPMIIEPNGYPPKFLQLFNDCRTKIGATIKFEARLTGTQPLNVKFLFRIKSILEFNDYILGLLVI
jgi:hypothetical protein